MALTEAPAKILTLKGVSKSFDQVPVLRDINLTLHEGEILFLLGASGCGKTTLLRLIAGFEVADEGSLRIRDQVMFDAQTFVPPKDRRLGYVLQEGVLFPHLNVYRNIAYGLGNGKGKTSEERQQIEAVMALTGIAGLADRMPYEISGGQQQRVALARALVLNPGLMLLDEPFSALDEHLRAQIREDVTDILRRSNAAAVIVTHDRHEALSHADKIALIQAGQLVQLDTPRNLYHRPATIDVARFISDRSLFLAATLKGGQNLFAYTEIAPSVPVEMMPKTQAQIKSVGSGVSEQGINKSVIDGQVMIRSDQLLPTDAKDPQALFVAELTRINFHGHHSQWLLRAGDDIEIELSVGREHETLKAGDQVGLKLVGAALFYPN
ncbi:ABC transporter ATP-binding protein [Orrella sp. 11846]|uniref:ABC transporter ATP-binding protein n=1 Tax=Orrella sp. 11846 TaxID=3409913 RepID=UPI003B5B7398